MLTMFSSRPVRCARCGAGALSPWAGAAGDSAHGAAAGRALDQAFGRQQLERAAHRDAGDAELAHQVQLAGQPVGEAPVGQLLAQHQIDLVVFRQRHRLHPV